jgi:hypothetical protein
MGQWNFLSSFYSIPTAAIFATPGHRVLCIENLSHLLSDRKFIVQRAGMSIVRESTEIRKENRAVWPRLGRANAGRFARPYHRATALTKGYIVTTRDERSFPKIPKVVVSTPVTGETDRVPLESKIQDPILMGPPALLSDPSGC